MEWILPQINLKTILPEIVVAAWGCLVMLVDPFLPERRKFVTFHLTWLGLVLASLVTVSLWNKGSSTLGGMALADNFTLLLKLVFILAALLTVLISHLKSEIVRYGEYFALIIFSTLGMMLMSSTLDLIVIFLGLEIMSVALYILAGFDRKDIKSTEASMKYFLMGAFATGFLLYGVALLYGVTGSTNLNVILAEIPAQSDSPLLWAGVGLLIVGLGFKVAAVPFHMWVPDVYEGAPTPITAFMTAGPKAAGFAALLRIFAGTLLPVKPDWTFVFWILAALTMTVGNVLAIAQHNIKRMLAYSSIAHAGYILITIVAAGEIGLSAALFYFFAYTLMNLGAFGVILALAEKGEKSANLADFSGMGLKYPALGVCMAIFMLSLSGIPPTAGFVGKFYIFSAAVKYNYIGLAIIGVLNSLISVYYYLRVVVLMFMQESKSGQAVGNLSWGIGLALFLTAAGTLWLGIFPGELLKITQESIAGLF